MATDNSLRPDGGVGDGGPAFPGDARGACYTGMTLRDWFAGQVISNITGTPADISELTTAAAFAYAMADAMLAQRGAAR